MQRADPPPTPRVEPHPRVRGKYTSTLPTHKGHGQRAGRGPRTHNLDRASERQVARFSVNCNEAALAFIRSLPGLDSISEAALADRQGDFARRILAVADRTLSSPTGRNGIRPRVKRARKKITNLARCERDKNLTI